MRRAITLDDETWARLEQLERETGRPWTVFVRDAIHEALQRRDKEREIFGSVKERVR